MKNNELSKFEKNRGKPRTREIRNKIKNKIRIQDRRDGN